MSLSLATAFADACRELHRYFSTVLSSRAFPSSLIFSSGTQEATPVLFPGVDMLNHCYGRKVSWLSDQVPDGKLKIVLDAGVERGVYCLDEEES